MQLGSSEHNQISSLITPKDLAVLLKVSNTTIYRIIESRKISFYKINGSIRFRHIDVETYMNGNRFEPLK
jgi:excisionase family DNA binding protein